MSIDQTFDKTIPSVEENDNDNNDDDEMVIMIYQALAKQMEYYFSLQNLMVDTYLQTLRELNDGCVPISIIANFSKIKTIVAPLLLLLQKHHYTKKLSIMSSTTTSTSTSSTSSTNDVVSDVPSNNNNMASSLSSKAHRMLEEEQRRIDIVLHVMQQEYCDHLQIYTIDSRTGKMTSNHQNQNTSSDASSSVVASSNTTTTILAIGFKPGCSMEHVTLVKNEPIHNNNNNNADNIDTSSTSVSSLDETNTLILRDVDPQVSEHELRTIFDMICDCPTIAKIVPDIAACWFITFATTDRYDLIRVMMQLRTMTYPSNGDPIMVRLRASVVPSQSTIIRVDSYDYHHHHHHSTMASTIHNMGDPCIAPKKKRRKKKRSKNKKNKTTSTTSVATTTSLGTSDASVTDTATTNKEPSLLDLSHDDFPSLLQHNTDKVEWSTSSIDMVSRSINDDIEDEVSHESSTNKEDECFEEDEEEVEDNDLEMKLTSKLRLNHSDTASTATTTSSNASSGSDTVKSPHYHGESTGASPAVLSGYAAAVRRVVSSSLDGPAASVPVMATTNLPVVESIGCMEVEVSSASTSDGKNGCFSELSSSTPSITDSPYCTEDHHTDHCVFTETEPAEVKMPPIKWGTRRSFVDVIRESSSSNDSMKQ